MQTTCPECRTTFRVSQEHLALRRGLVRCGRCNAVFNAYDTLLPELAEPPSAGEEHVDAADWPAARRDDRENPEYAHEETPHSAPPRLETMPEVLERFADPLPDTLQAQALAESTPEPAHEPGQPAPEHGPAWSTPGQRDTAETSESILLSQLPSRLPPAKPALPRWKSVLYGFAIALASVLLLLQLTYFLRAELAAALPASRPVLVKLCAPLGCRVPLPRQLTRQAIVASSLEHDPEQKSRVRLTFLLANRTGQTQAWPHVILTLSDVREAPVAQKVFPPADYLPKDVSLRAGMPAASEREARLDLDVGNLSASGYALSLTYP